MQTIPGWSFDTEYLAIAQKHKFRIIEVPVEWFDEKTNAKYTFKDSLREFFGIYEVQRNRLKGLYSKKHVKRKLGTTYKEYILNWE
jgi:hypothetical protein